MRVAIDTFDAEEMEQVRMGYFPETKRFRLIFETPEEATMVQNILERLVREFESEVSSPAPVGASQRP